MLDTIGRDFRSISPKTGFKHEIKYSSEYFELEYEDRITGYFLSGSPIIETVSEELEVLGGLRDWEPEWRNGQHYQYGGQWVYASLLFMKKKSTGQVGAFSTNGYFVNAEIPDQIPEISIWKTGKSVWIRKRDSGLEWSAKPIE